MRFFPSTASARGGALDRRGPKIVWAVWAVLLALCACAATAVNYTVIDQGSASGKPFPPLHFDLIAEAAPFEKLFSEIHSDRLPPPAPPKIDFQTSLVVFVSLGEKPSAGYRMTVDEVTRAQETVRVKIGVQEPPSHEFQAAVITRPFILIEIKKEAGLRNVALVDAENKVIQLLPVP